MNDLDKTKQQLIEELARLRQQVVGQEARLARKQQSEADQRQINDSLPVLVATSGLDGYYKRVNAAFERILGWSEEESLSRPFMEFIHPDDRAVAVETFDRLQSGETVTDFVDRNICKDGSHRWINWIVIPLLDRSIVFGIGQDITEKKLAEEERQRLEAKWCSVVGNAPVFVALLDDEDKIQFLNRAAPGMSVEDAIGKSTYEFLQPEYVAKARESIARVRRTGETTFYECVGAGPNGGLSWYETHVGPVLVDDEIVAVSLIANDVTERKQAEAALKQSHEELERRVKERTTELVEANTSLKTEIQERVQAEELLSQSEAKYRAFVESSPDAVVRTDLQGRVTFASHQAAELHGVGNPREMIGRPAFELFSEEERDRLRKNMSLLVEQGIRKNNEYTALRENGTTFPVEISSAVIRNGGGEPVALMAVYRDVTERKQAQDALRKEQGALRRMLQASDRDRELVTYEIHDGVAQRLLGALLHFEAVSQMERGVSGEAEAAFDTGLVALREASVEARSLMNRTRTPVLQEFGIREAIFDFIDQLSDRPNAPEITFRCETHFERLEPVLENAIFRVAQEAITNARIHGKSESVRVTLIQEDEEVTVEIQDSGIGFDTTKVVEGRFGLDGIRERTRLLGKDLGIESTPGKGTRIRATFPLIYREEQTE